MARLGLLGGLVCGGVGCGSDPSAVELDTSTESTSADLTTTTSSSSTTIGGGSPEPDGGDTTTSGGGSSGGVEDTVFGMSDDMPLVADIPDIKHDLFGVGTWVRLEQVVPISGRAELEGAAWFYVQDPTFEEHMALRVLLLPGDAVPSRERMADLEGWVQSDAQGWMLALDWAVEGGAAPAVQPRSVRVSTLVSAAGVALDDALVEVAEPSGLVVRRRGPVEGTVLVSGATTRGAVLVDLRPFGLAATTDLPPGTQLSRLRGVAELDGSAPVILPRSSGDLVVVE